jgi:MerR family redox-sensitive transcriptional activator SoxR
MSTAPAVPTLLTIGEVARRSGVAASALRFYEQRGLIRSERAGSGHRRYPRPVLRRIAFIVFAQRIGFTLGEIAAELAKLPAGDAPSRHDWSGLSETWMSRIDQRITQLELLKAGLTQCIGCGCLSIDHCRLANPRDAAARLGPGPRYWVGDCPPDGQVEQVTAAVPVAEGAVGAAASSVATGCR